VALAHTAGTRPARVPVTRSICCFIFYFFIFFGLKTELASRQQLQLPELQQEARETGFVQVFFFFFLFSPCRLRQSVKPGASTVPSGLDDTINFNFFL
jgi:hypothetical protein